ncbi:MAG TPA: hypothetical protein VMT96_00050 [Candidatus Bathyarchaeia archaeon]|nr:hypothetical protein [Candidatus Bathyarchaeia archaeon]
MSGIGAVKSIYVAPNAGAPMEFAEADARRNVVTTGIDLDRLVDVHFQSVMSR